MRKILAWALVFLATCVVSAGLLLFSPIGNTILTPFAQSLLNHSLPFSTQIHTLRIRFGSLESTLTINKTFSLKLSGAYSLRGVDMVAEVYLPESSEPLTELYITGSYGDYTIATKIPPDMRSPLQSPLPPSSQAATQSASTATLQSTSQSGAKSSLQLSKAQSLQPQVALLARMRFFHTRSYALRVQDLPMEVYARFLSLDIAPSGYASLLMQADPHTLQIGIKSSGFSLENLSGSVGASGTRSKVLGVDFYYKQTARVRELTGRFALPYGELMLKGEAQGLDSALRASLYLPKNPSKPLASLHAEMLDTSVRYELAANDMGAIGELLGLRLGGRLDLRGEIGIEGSLAFHVASESLGGLASVDLRENLLQFSGEGLSLMRILELLRLPTSLDAQVACKGVYNLAFHKGSLEASGQNLSIMLDDLARYGLEAFSANNSAQDSWGVGFETSQADARFVLSGQLDGAQLDGSLTASAQDHRMQTRRFFVDLQAQYMQIEFLEPEIKLEGKFSAFSTDANTPAANAQTQSLQDIYNDENQQMELNDENPENP